VGARRLDTDVLVVGGGTMGSFTLWRLAARGVRALGFERFTPGHDRGAGHGESRMIRTAYYEGPQYVPLVRAAFSLWRDLERETATPLLEMNGALMIGRPDGELVAGALASAREHGLRNRLLDTSQAGREYPQHRLRPGEVVLWEEGAGALRPEAAIAAAAARARALGATLLEQQAVSRLRAAADVVEVTAGGMTYRAPRAVVAVGAWTQGLLEGANPAPPELPLEVTREVMAWFPARRPGLFSRDRFPGFMRDEGDAIWYGLASPDGHSVKVGLHHGGRPTDPDAVDREIHAEDVAPLARRVQEHMPDLGPAPVRGVACTYTSTPDRHFLVGAVPGLPNVTVLAGFSGHGFKFAPVIGEIASDLATTGATRHPVEGFAPDRLLKPRGPSPSRRG
jgi:sarcosine oxidase